MREQAPTSRKDRVYDSDDDDDDDDDDDHDKDSDDEQGDDDDGDGDDDHDFACLMQYDASWLQQSHFPRIISHRIHGTGIFTYIRLIFMVN